MLAIKIMGIYEYVNILSEILDQVFLLASISEDYEHKYDLKSFQRS